MRVAACWYQYGKRLLLSFFATLAEQRASVCNRCRGPCRPVFVKLVYRCFFFCCICVWHQHNGKLRAASQKTWRVSAWGGANPSVPLAPTAPLAPFVPPAPFHSFHSRHSLHSCHSPCTLPVLILVYRASGEWRVALVARVARVARVAQVARVPRVARLAQVA